MSDERKPHKVRAIITRVVRERAIVTLERDGSIREYEETIEELDTDAIELVAITDVITCW